MKRLLHALAGDAAGALVQSFVDAARERGVAIEAEHASLAAVLAAAYPALRGQMAMRPEDVVAISRGKLRLPRDARAYRRLAAPLVPDLGDEDGVLRGLRVFAQRERL